MNNLELKQLVETLVSEVRRTHRYSMSSIYGTYNQVFEKHEVPQSCASCLKRKVNELEKWLNAQNEITAVAEPKKKAARKKKTE